MMASTNVKKYALYTLEQATTTAATPFEELTSKGKVKELLPTYLHHGRCCLTKEDLM